MPKSNHVSRRRVVVAGAALGLVAAPFVRGAHAAGKLSVGFWDHWVPNANDATSALVKEWGEKEKVDVTLDFITTHANKLLLTGAAESQAKSGHDILALTNFLPARYSEQMVAVNDLMDELVKTNGPVNATVEYLGKLNGKWLAIPATVGSQIKGPCSRIDLLKKHAGIDIQAMYPAGTPPKADNWNLDTFLKFYKKLMQFLPKDVSAWDDASNNKFLISGQGSLIMNPPSAWAVAKRDAPQVAEQCWTHGFPKGPNGRFAPFVPFFWGIWNFSKNQPAAKSLLMHLSQPASIEKMVVASGGYDLPSFEKLTTLKVWADAEPPKGTLFHYPNPYKHQVLSTASAPAPHKIAEQISTASLMCQMAVRHYTGEPMEKVLAWAEGEVEGYMRT